MSAARRCAAATLLAMAAIAGAPERSPASAVEPDVVARVNGEPVTRAEWRRMVADPLTRRLHQRDTGLKPLDAEELQRWALQHLVNQRLTLQEARRRGITVAEQEIEQGVAAWRARFKGPKKYGKWLQSRALDERALRETIRTDLLVTRLRAALLRDLQIPDEDVQAYYDAHQGTLRVPEAVRLRIIAVTSLAAADDIVAAVHQGEAFERLAEQRSIAARAIQAVDGRWVSLPDLPPALRQAVAALQPGEISGPLQGAAEAIVVRLEERRPERTQTLAEARPEIEQRLMPERVATFLRAWLAEQARSSTIEILP